MLYPQYVSFADWAMSLQVDFPNTVIIVADRNKGDKIWKEWAKLMCATPLFLQYQVSVPKHELNWQEWAKMVYNILSIAKPLT